MTLDIVGAGFGRTGTHSIKLALEQLGFGPCYHMYEIRKDPGKLLHWQEAAKGQMPDWADVFSGYRSQMDWPGSAYWRELVAAFPEAKVILSIRDPEDWYRSIRSTILLSVTEGLHLDADPVSKAASQMIFDTVHRNLFQGKLDDKDSAIARFQKHIDDVRTEIPADRLLLYDVASGWGPICKFLDIEVPSSPFPKTNTVDEFLRKKPHLKELAKSFPS